MKIKGIVSDFGGVLSLPQETSVRVKLALLAGLPLDVFERRYFALRSDYDAGRHSDREYWNAVLGNGRHEVSEDTLKTLVDTDIAGWFRPNLPFLDWLASVRPRMERVVMLSNMPDTGLLYLKANFMQRLGAFDTLVFSCEVGEVKPAPAMFLKAAEAAGLPAGTLLFIDDNAPNVEAARRLGFPALLYADHAAFLEAVAGMGLGS